MHKEQAISNYEQEVSSAEGEATFVGCWGDYSDYCSCCFSGGKHKVNPYFVSFAQYIFSTFFFIKKGVLFKCYGLDIILFAKHWL